jgi:hypothetical protein
MRSKASRPLGIRPSPRIRTLWRGWLSTKSTLTPARVNIKARALPAGPAPTTTTGSDELFR